jgi:hypothetical protein
VLYGNKIEVIEGLRSMVKLKEINLKKNRIVGSSIEHIASNSQLVLSLENLNLSYNVISDQELDNVATVIL